MALVQTLYTEIKKAYDIALLQNVDSVSYIESALRTSLLLIPGRFNDKEMQSEIAQALINLIILNHDSIWLKYGDKLKKTGQMKGLDERLQRRLMASKTLPKHYVNSLFWLQALKIVQLPLEIIGTEVERANRDSTTPYLRNMWFITIFLIELIKAAIHLNLLSKNKGKITAYNAIPQREPTDQAEQDQIDRIMYHPGTGQLRRKSLRTIKQMIDIKKSQMQRIMLVPGTPATSGTTTGEILWIIRPLVYLLALYVWKKGSWKPWLASLTIDVMSAYYSWRQNTNARESRELWRRFSLWAFYLLRSPCYEGVFEHRLAAIVGLFGRLPLVNVVTGFGTQVLQLYRERYFYTSAT